MTRTSKLFVALCGLPLLVGCVNIKGERTGPDGSKLSISAQRFLWSSQDLSFTTMTDDGVAVELKASNSSSDADAIASLSGALGEVAKTAIAK